MTTKVTFTDLRNGDEISLQPKLINEIRAAKYGGETCLMVVATVVTDDRQPEGETYFAKSTSFTNYHNQ